MSLPRNELQKLTSIYWDKHRKGKTVEAWDFYLGQSHDQFGNSLPSLLQLEMDYARQADRLPEVWPNTTLVILVGESFEPLLQSIWAHRPVRLVPVVNAHYGDRDPDSPNHVPGRQQWKLLRKRIEDLPPAQTKQLVTLPAKNSVQTTADDPTEVFTFLRDELRDDLLDPGKTVIIDITGAKKTMVAGAFLLATYSKAQINYIDTDQYLDGRPCGFACNFKTVRNPLEQLSLYTWQQIEQRYRQYDFAGAQDLLDLIAATPQMDTPQSLQELRLFLTVADHWENGSLREAAEAANALPAGLKQLLPPTVHPELAKHWPAADGRAWLDISFFRNPAFLISYARDELSRARRLADMQEAASEMRRDYRAAFTRAYAVYETILKSMVACLYFAAESRIQIEGEAGQEYSRAQLDRAAIPWFLYFMLADHARDLLQAPNTIRAKWKIEEEMVAVGLTYQARLADDPEYRPFPVRPWATSRAAFEKLAAELRARRNRIIHTYFPATAELAGKAIDFAAAHLANYEDDWAVWYDPGLSLSNLPPYSAYSMPDWDEVRLRCRLSFIPEQARLVESSPDSTST